MGDECVLKRIERDLTLVTRLKRFASSLNTCDFLSIEYLCRSTLAREPDNEVGLAFRNRSSIGEVGFEACSQNGGQVGGLVMTLMKWKLSINGRVSRCGKG